NPAFTVSIATTSIDTDNSKRDKDLKDKDYFDAATYPAIKFKSKPYKKTGGQTFVLGGDLTIKGTTNYVELEGKHNGIIPDPKSKELKARLRFTGVLNRKDFTVCSSISPMGDEVAITINLEMVQQ